MAFFKQIAFLDIEKSKIEKNLISIETSYKNLSSPNYYQTYDLAQFLKNNQKFKKSIKYYSKILQNISRSHELYPKVKDGRGIAYEQTRNWQKLKKIFRLLEAKPDQAYVINYLAYS